MTNIEYIRLIVEVLYKIINKDDLWDIYLYAKEKID